MTRLIWDIFLLLLAVMNFVWYLFLDGDVVNVVFGCTAIILLRLGDRK